MDPITQQTVLAAAGAAGGEKVYVDDVFSTWVQEGVNGSKTITNGIDFAGQGGMVWHKNRTDTNGYSHHIHDTERSPQSGMPTSHRLSTDSEGKQYSDSDYLTSWNSNGYNFTGPNGAYGTGESFVSWSFRKAPGFFDVVTYTGDGISNRAVPHSLGSVPGMIVVKQTNTSGQDWHVWHRSMNPAWTGGTTAGSAAGGNNTGWIGLNLTDAYSGSRGAFTYVNSTAFGVYRSNLELNSSGSTYVAYIFAHDDAQFGTGGDESIIKCGSYTGSGSVGKTIDLGFEPQWILVKNTDASTPWVLIDIMRGAPTDGGGKRLTPNEPDAENTNSYFAITPTGLEVVVQNTYVNTSGQDYIYMAIRRPNKPPEAATDVFAIDTWGGTSPTPPTFTSGFPVDTALRIPTGSTNKIWANRMTGIYFQNTNSDSAEDYASSFKWDYMNGWASSTGTDSGYYSYMFKRAPGFMDVVTYSGTNSARTVNHNLGVVPELIIAKGRDIGFGWGTYDKTSGPTKYMHLNETGAVTTSSAPWNDTAPTSSVFSTGTSTITNYNNYHFIAYLFATLPGISKVGSYTGSSSAVDVDCGFTNGARFVLIKRTDQSGNWYVFDTTRGIVSGNDPALWLNSSNAQITNTDYIDPLSSGFTVTTASGDINESGGTYIFLAIA